MIQEIHTFSLLEIYLSETSIALISVNCNKKVQIFNDLKSRTLKNMFCFLTNINRFQSCFKSDWFSWVHKLVRDIGHLKVTGSELKPDKGFGKIFRVLKTLAQRRVRTGDRQIPGLTTILLHHSGFLR